VAHHPPPSCRKTFDAEGPDRIETILVGRAAKLAVAFRVCAQTSRQESVASQPGDTIAARIVSCSVVSAPSGTIERLVVRTLDQPRSTVGAIRASILTLADRWERQPDLHEGSVGKVLCPRLRRRSRGPVAILLSTDDLLDFLLGPLIEHPHPAGKALLGDSAGLRSARVGACRVVYEIDESDLVVRVVNIE